MNWIERSLSTQISPMVYIMMFVSVAIGFFFMTGFTMAGNESILYSTGVLINSKIWGTLLFCSALIAEIGFVTKQDSLISLGGIFGLSLWAFATLSLLMAGHVYVLVTIGLFHLLFHGYVILANAMGILVRKDL